MKKGNLKSSLGKKLPDCSLPVSSQQQLTRKRPCTPHPRRFLKVRTTTKHVSSKHFQDAVQIPIRNNSKFLATLIVHLLFLLIRDIFPWFPAEYCRLVWVGWVQ